MFHFPPCFDAYYLADGKSSRITISCIQNDKTSVHHLKAMFNESSLRCTQRGHSSKTTNLTVSFSPFPYRITLQHSAFNTAQYMRPKYVAKYLGYVSKTIRSGHLKRGDEMSQQKPTRETVDVDRRIRIESSTQLS